MTEPHDPGGRSKPAWRPGATVTARFSDCDRYRYEMAEVWNESEALIMWLMMNPSVANIEHSDPTLMKTGTFTRAWGFGGQFIGNIHAYRATDKQRLLEVADPVGPENDAAILSMAARAAFVVLAYGQPPKPMRARAPRVVKMLQDASVRLMYLRKSADGTPWHPLYLPGSCVPLLW